MRVTNSMMISNMLSNLNRNLNVMSRRQDELATGKRVIHASDDPVATAKIMKFKTDLADMAQFSNNTRDAQAWLDASESCISEMGSVLQRVRELAVQAANGTNTPSDTNKIKEEIVQLKENLISSGNFNFAGRYLFSSYHTDQALLKSDGTYNIPITQNDIDNKPVSVYEVSAKEYMNVGTHGVEIFGYVLDSSTYATLMPDAKSTNGIAPEKSFLDLNVDLTQNYSTSDFQINVNGTNYVVETGPLMGSPASKIDPQKMIDAVRNGKAGAVSLSEVADVFYDKNNHLIIKNRTIGTAGTIALPTLVVPAAGITGTATAGINATQASINSLGPLSDLPSTNVADFKGKQFVMSYNGVTKTITVPNNAATTTVAALDTDLQGVIDSAFGTGKVNVNLTAAIGTPMFSTINVPGSTDKPQLQIQPIRATQSELIVEMNQFITALSTGDNATCSQMIGEIDGHLNNLLAVRADVGARGTRLDLISAKIAENSVTFTRLLSDNQDADMSEVIMYLKNAENVYKAALGVGGRIIQPSLVDYLR